MKLISRVNPWIFALLMLVSAFSFSSCAKSGDTVAKIKVLNVDDSSPIVGATVILDPDNEVLENKPQLLKETTTNSRGEASFNYNELYKKGQAGLFVLDVRVEATIDGIPTVGEGIIKVEEEETSEATIEL